MSISKSLDGCALIIFAFFVGAFLLAFIGGEYFHETIGLHGLLSFVLAVITVFILFVAIVWFFMSLEALGNARRENTNRKTNRGEKESDEKGGYIALAIICLSVVVLILVGIPMSIPHIEAYKKTNMQEEFYNSNELIGSWTCSESDRLYLYGFKYVFRTDNTFNLEMKKDGINTDDGYVPPTYYRVRGTYAWQGKESINLIFNAVSAIKQDRPVHSGSFNEGMQLNISVTPIWEGHQGYANFRVNPNTTNEVSENCTKDRIYD